MPRIGHRGNTPHPVEGDAAAPSDKKGGIRGAIKRLRGAVDTEPFDIPNTPENKEIIRNGGRFIVPVEVTGIRHRVSVPTAVPVPTAAEELFALKDVSEHRNFLIPFDPFHGDKARPEGAAAAPAIPSPLQAVKQQPQQPPAAQRAQRASVAAPRENVRAPMPQPAEASNPERHVQFQPAPVQVDIRPAVAKQPQELPTPQVQDGAKPYNFAQQLQGVKDLLNGADEPAVAKQPQELPAPQVQDGAKPYNFAQQLQGVKDLLDGTDASPASPQSAEPRTSAQPPESLANAPSQLRSFNQSPQKLAVHHKTPTAFQPARQVAAPAVQTNISQMFTQALPIPTESLTQRKDTLVEHGAMSEAEIEADLEALADLDFDADSITLQTHQEAEAAELEARLNSLFGKAETSAASETVGKEPSAKRKQSPLAVQ
jgi:hypothetical protein